jgi:hypothetical protein
VTNCPYASASGGATTDNCGTPCDAYCSSVMFTCSGAYALFKDNAACLAACAYYPDNPALATTGNSRQCRAYHAGKALSNAATHCPHASPAGGGICHSLDVTDGCDYYCDKMVRAYA